MYRIVGENIKNVERCGAARGQKQTARCNYLGLRSGVFGGVVGVMGVVVGSEGGDGREG